MRRMLSTIALAAVVGCGGDDSPAPRALEGTYPLVTVDGRALPTVVIEVPGYKLEVLSRTITVGANAAFTDSYTIRETEDGVVHPVRTVTCSGSWTRSGNTVTLTETQTTVDCGGIGVAAWDGNNTLTIDWESTGIAFVHRR